MTVELGILSLSDLQTDPASGGPVAAPRRTDEIVGYGTLADRLGLDVFAVGEHHTLDFAVSSPAVVLAAVAARTERIRLASGVTVLSVLEPVRVYQDFATLDLLSHGRTDVIVGRSAFPEPFAIFGVPSTATTRCSTKSSCSCSSCATTTTSPGPAGSVRPCTTPRSPHERGSSRYQSGPASAAHPPAPSAPAASACRSCSASSAGASPPVDPAQRSAADHRRPGART
jgi:hypothetical protein